MSKRALRRHHKERMRKRADFLLRAFHGQDLDGLIGRWARYRGDNFTICSCYLCGNPRRKDASKPKSRQEVKADLDFEEQVKDLE